MSQQRADGGSKALLHELTRRAGGPAIAGILQHRAIGIGNLRPVVANAVTEEQMRKNRRIEITIIQCQLTPPNCQL